MRESKRTKNFERTNVDDAHAREEMRRTFSKFGGIMPKFGLCHQNKEIDSLTATHVLKKKQLYFVYF